MDHGTRCTVYMPFQVCLLPLPLALLLLLLLLLPKFGAAAVCLLAWFLAILCTYLIKAVLPCVRFFFCSFFFFLFFFLLFPLYLIPASVRPVLVIMLTDTVGVLVCVWSVREILD